MTKVNSLTPRFQSEKGQMFHGRDVGTERLPKTPTMNAIPPIPSPSQIVVWTAMDFYNLLALPVRASTDEIKKAYRKKALEWHPGIQKVLLYLQPNNFYKIKTTID